MQMRPNRVKDKLQNGERAYAVTGLYSPDEIDAFAPALLANGIDAVWFDGEHGPATPSELGDMTRACDLWGMTSMVRIGHVDHNTIFRTLDRGAQAVVAPHVQTPQQARTLVEGGKFPPIGSRGVYLGRQGYGVTDYFKVADQHSMLVAMIEDVQGVKNLDAIMDTPHIDMFFIGAWDLAGSMGYLNDRDNPDVVKTVHAVIETLLKGDRRVGVFTLKKDAPRYAAAGVQFFMTLARELLATGANDFVQAPSRTA